MNLAHPVFGTPVPSGWEVLSVDGVKSPEKSSCVAGPFGSNISAKYFVAEGIPVIRGSNLTDDLTKFVSDSFVFVSPEQALTYPAQHVRAGDLVFTCWGTIGQVALIPDDGPYDEYIISNKQLKLRPDTSHADPLFLYYYFASPAMMEHIRNRAIGSAVPGINLGILKSLPVVLPPLAVQRKITALLSAYDDLIENNNRRIKLLEEMAERIYREWFVDFRYPGHERVPLVESELGPMPEKWTASRLSDIADLVRGRSYRGVELVETGGVPFVNLKCMMRGGGFRRDGLKRYVGKHNLDQQVTEGDIVLAVTDLTQGREILARATLVPRLADAFGVISLDVARIVPHDAADRLALFFALRCTDFPNRVAEFANGSTVLHLSPTHVSDGQIVWPSEGLRRRFVRTVEPMVAEAGKLAEASEMLAPIRDLMIPRLISGEVDVTDLDIAIPEVAA